MNRVIKDPIAEAEKARKKKAKHAPPPKTLAAFFTGTQTRSVKRAFSQWEGWWWVYFRVSPDLPGSIRG